MLGILTVILSFISLRIIYISKFLHNPFGAICAAQSITEAFAGICFGLWAAPMAYFYPEYSKSFIGSLFGCIVAFCYYQTMYLHLWKSMNRTYAAIFPIHYHTKFTIKIGNIILVITIVMSTFAINQYFEYQCNYHFDPMTFLWRQREPTCSQIRQISLISLLTTVFGCVICDTITFCVMIILKKKIYSASNKAYERRFFIQVSLN
uniref:7TM GPCR serpentine receptor class x (Srx) domain-containing protein n=1 Tax=Panagrolaimus sp. PS1159 TaxID=55785 RepID=A0AC35GXJ2_9BILA